MARSIPAALAAAVNATGAQPTISITTQDFQSRYSRLASTGFSAARNAAIYSSGSSIIRAAVSQHGDPNTVTAYRIPSPTTAANWPAAAVATLSTNAMASAGVCLVQSGSTIRCFWCDITSQGIKYADSTDDGVTWGAAQTAQSIPPSVTSICQGIVAESTTSIVCAYQAFTYAAAGFYQTKVAAGVWGAWSGAIGPLTPVWGATRGIHMDASRASRVLVGGVQMRAQQSGFAASATTWDGVATWSAFASVHEMDTPSNGLSNNWPTVHYNSADGYYYSAITLADDGSVSGTAQNRTNVWRSTDGLTWQLAGAAGTVFSYEAHILVISGTTYVFDHASVWTAPGSPGPTDLTADVLTLDIHEQTQTWARFSLTLANNNGQYLNLANLRDNASIQIALGYNGTSIATHTCYLDAIRHEATGEQLITVVEGRGIGKFLAQVSPKLITFASKTVAQIAVQICATAGVPLGSLPGTSQFSQVVACFTITQGETYDNALKRLSNVYDFDFYETGSPSVFIKIVERAQGDGASWSYGQETLAASIQTDSDQANIIRVVGATTGTTNVFAEVTDQPNIAATGAHRLRHIVDRLLDTAAKCRLKAQLALRDEQTSATTAQLTVTVNPQLEVMDVISHTDARIGTAAASLRIHDIHTQIDFHQGLWAQHLTCQKP
jgi:hypothetical protein